MSIDAEKAKNEAARELIHQKKSQLELMPRHLVHCEKEHSNARLLREVQLYKKFEAQLATEIAKLRIALKGTDTARLEVDEALQFEVVENQGHANELEKRLHQIKTRLAQIDTEKGLLLYQRREELQRALEADHATLQRQIRRFDESQRAGQVLQAQCAQQSRLCAENQALLRNLGLEIRGLDAKLRAHESDDYGAAIQALEAQLEAEDSRLRAFEEKALAVRTAFGAFNASVVRLHRTLNDSDVLRTLETAEKAFEKLDAAVQGAWSSYRFQVAYVAGYSDRIRKLQQETASVAAELLDTNQRLEMMDCSIRDARGEIDCMEQEILRSRASAAEHAALEQAAAAEQRRGVELRRQLARLKQLEHMV